MRAKRGSSKHDSEQVRSTTPRAAKLSSRSPWPSETESRKGRSAAGPEPAMSASRSGTCARAVNWCVARRTEDPPGPGDGPVTTQPALRASPRGSPARRSWVPAAVARGKVSTTLTEPEPWRATTTRTATEAPQPLTPARAPNRAIAARATLCPLRNLRSTGVRISRCCRPPPARQAAARSAPSLGT